MEPVSAFHESLTTVLQEVHSEGSEWDVVLIEAGLSKNGTYYSEETLQKSVHLFEGVKACVYRFGEKLDHLPEDIVRAMPQGLAGNVVGWFEKGIMARFRILEGAKWLRDNLLDAWKRGKRDLLGFSIDARGQARAAIISGQQVRKVETITKVESTDVVTNPAAGGELMRLVASFREAETKLGNFLRTEAERKNISMEALGLAAGISESTVGQIMRGEIKRPPDRRLAGFARALGVSMKRLLDLIPEDIREAYNREHPFEAMVDLIECHRPQWLEGFAAPNEGADLQDYVIRVMESTHDRAEQILQEDVREDEIDRLAEVSRGIKVMASAIQMIKDGKVDEAVKLLQEFVKNPVPEGGDERAQRMSSVSFPFKKQTAPAGPAKESKMSDDTMTAEQIEAKAKEQADLDAKLKEREDELATREKEMRVSETTVRIDAKLKESGLPELAVARLREQLVAKAGGDEALADDAIDAMIKSEVEYVASFKETAPAAAAAASSAAALPPASGLADAHQDTSKLGVGDDEMKKYGHAWDGFFQGDGRMIEGVQPFRSVRQAWGHITGAWCDPEILAYRIMEALGTAFPRDPITRMDAHLEIVRGRWDRFRESQHFLREAIVTSDFPVSFGDSLFRRMQKEYDEDPRNDWRDIVSTIENLSDLTNSQNLIRIGGIGTLPVVNEQAPYQEVGVIRSIPRKLGSASVRTVHELVWNEIESNPLMADGNALFSAAHNNILVGAGAISYDNVSTLMEQLKKQTEQDSGKRLGLRPSWLIVSPDLAKEALEITDSTAKQVAADDATTRSFVNAMNVKRFETLGLGVTTPTINRFYVSTNNRDGGETIVVGFLGGRDRPDIFVQSPVDTPTSGAAFTADELTFKVRLGVGVKVADHRWIQASLVAGP